MTVISLHSVVLAISKHPPSQRSNRRTINTNSFGQINQLSVFQASFSTNSYDFTVCCKKMFLGAEEISVGLNLLHFFLFLWHSGINLQFVCVCWIP